MGDRRTPRERPHGRDPKPESGHGPQTRRRMIEQLESGATETSRDERMDSDRARGAASGRRRLVEDREQHDEAEKNSESQHLFEASRHGGIEGPSDNSGNLNGQPGNQEPRADNTTRDTHGREEKPRIRRNSR